MIDKDKLGIGAEDGIGDYLERLTRTPLLKPEEERELTRAARNGDEKARQRLIEANMRLVINIAKNYKVKQIPLEDLIQEGAIGLMQAAERFDPDRGFRFSTYATHWIRQAIGRAVDNKSKTIRMPSHASQTYRHIERERAVFQQANGREPLVDELAKLVGITEKKLNSILVSAHEIVSLDLPVGDRFGSTLSSILPDQSGASPEDEAMKMSTSGELKNAVSELSEREQMVIEMKYASNGQELPIEQIAAKLCMSRERTRHIEISAIRKLQEIARRKRLTDLL
jgi:RNA polymerase primary sigma factor